MSRMSEEMNVIPRTAWAIAVIFYMVFVGLCWLVFIPRDEELSGWPRGALMLFTVVMPLFLATWVLLIGYVNVDARRRGMRHVLWTLLAIFVPNAIGIILYFIMRDRPMRACPKCGQKVPGGFAFCPGCGTEIARTCPHCRGSIESGWSHCPHCGKGLRAA